MDDTDKKKVIESELHFYYDREHRLEHASERVRELYENRPLRRFGMFSSLTDTKPKAAMFVSIVVMCLMILFATYMLPGNGKTLVGNTVQASVMRYEDSSFIVLKKKAGRGAKTGLVDITVSLPAGDNTRTDSFTVAFTNEPEEEFRRRVPFEGRELHFLLRMGDKTTSITAVSE